MLNGQSDHKLVTKTATTVRPPVHPATCHWHKELPNAFVHSSCPGGLSQLPPVHHVCTQRGPEKRLGRTGCQDKEASACQPLCYVPCGAYDNPVSSGVTPGPRLVTRELWHRGPTACPTSGQGGSQAPSPPANAPWWTRSTGGLQKGNVITVGHIKARRR